MRAAAVGKVVAVGKNTKFQEGDWVTGTLGTSMSDLPSRLVADQSFI